MKLLPYHTDLGCVVRVKELEVFFPAQFPYSHTENDSTPHKYSISLTNVLCATIFQNYGLVTVETHHRRAYTKSITTMKEYILERNGDHKLQVQGKEVCKLDSKVRETSGISITLSSGDNCPHIIICNLDGILEFCGI